VLRDGFIQRQSAFARHLLKTYTSQGRFARNVSVLTAANLAGAGLSFLQGIIVARILGPESYGIVALIMTYPNLVYSFLSAKSGDATIKYLGQFHSQGERKQSVAMCGLGYTVDLVVAVLAFGIIIVTASWAAANIVQRPDLAWLIPFYAIALVPQSLRGTSHAVLSILERFTWAAAIQIATTVARFVSVIALVLLGFGVAGVIWGNLIGFLINGMLYAGSAFWLIRTTWHGWWWQQNFWHDLQHYRRDIVRFLGLNEVSALAGMIPKQLDIIVLGYFSGPTQVGYYRLAKSLTDIIALLVSPLQSVVYPRLSSLWGAGQHRAAHKQARTMALMLGLPLGALVMLIGIPLVPFVLPLLVGNEYAPAIVATQLLLTGAAAWLAFFWIRPFVLAKGGIKMWTGISVLVACMSLAAYFVVIPIWGYLGLAAWLMAMNFLGHGIALIWLLAINSHTQADTHDSYTNEQA
jgi:O-antigen/teichoic acid export membrane protein